jgi:hypothetical protein
MNNLKSSELLLLFLLLLIIYLLSNNKDNFTTTYVNCTYKSGSNLPSDFNWANCVGRVPIGYQCLNDIHCQQKHFRNYLK